MCDTDAKVGGIDDGTGGIFTGACLSRAVSDTISPVGLVALAGNIASGTTEFVRSDAVHVVDAGLSARVELSDSNTGDGGEDGEGLHDYFCGGGWVVWR